MICKRITYFGRVQGVGFRYTAQTIARAYDVAGFVRNRDDGSVELVAQGDAEQVNAFLDAVAMHMTNNIESMYAQDDAPGDYEGFTVRH